VGTYKLTQSRHAIRNIRSAFICNTDLGCRCNNSTNSNNITNWQHQQATGNWQRSLPHIQTHRVEVQVSFGTKGGTRTFLTTNTSPTCECLIDSHVQVVQKTTTYRDYLLLLSYLFCEYSNEYRV